MNDMLRQATSLRKRGELEKARRILLDLVKREPENPTVHYQAACVHDEMGSEREAIPLYERAISCGLSGNDLEEATIGLGSSYRALGNYGKAIESLRHGVERFPRNRAMQVFLAMSLYNSGDYHEAMKLALQNLAETSEDESISGYHQAIAFYAERLDEVWD